MDIWELIEQLTVIANQLEERGVDSPKLVVAQQPSYPLEGAFRGVTVDDDKVIFLSGEATEYSSSDYWNEV